MLPCWASLSAHLGNCHRAGGPKPSSVTSYLGYAGGFAGNYVGMLIEDRLALGTLVVRTFMPPAGTTWSGGFAKPVSG